LFLNNRHYDPQTGVFVSVDPLVTMTGQPYIYGAANPITYSDPSGLGPDTSAHAREGAGGCSGGGSALRSCNPTPAIVPVVRVNQIADELGNASARSLGFDGGGTVGQAPSNIRKAAFAWLGQYGDPNPTWDDLRVADIPLSFIILQSGLGDLTIDELTALLSSIPAPRQKQIENMEHTYDRWCGCGNWVNRPDGLAPWVAFFGLPKDELGIATNIGTTALTWNLPLGPTTGISVGIALLAEAYLAADYDIDPDQKAYADRNYWTTLSGLPQWPPFYGP